MDHVASNDAKTFLNTRREVEESLLVGDTTVIGEAELAAVNQNQEEKLDYIDIHSPVLSFNTRLDAKDENMTNIMASPFDRTNTAEIGGNSTIVGTPAKEMVQLQGNNSEPPQQNEVVLKKL